MEKLFKLFGKRQPQSGETLSNQSEDHLVNKDLDGDMLAQVVGGTDDTTTTTDTDPETPPGDDEVKDTSPIKVRSSDGIHPK
ncbi:hypothetical protein [Thalassomonas actiniarum]|uniref:Uncharacterized protein n=1 Tax=Thalassomonas actiniarum TaxID=485447 RepID=A0AAE9YTG1_9GAMM|nr:hypothetical protein [Thalassomonas actiniarum]WDD99959.1 hypothetical protein SG35_004670 [Thalassomonas actiniarum]